MLLQIAFDSPEHLALLPRVKGIADIVEIGTPVLKRFGIGVIATARELCPDTLVLADTKTVDGGQLEAEMVFGAGAAFMTVLSSTSSATHAAVGRVAADFGATVVVDTITELGKAELLPRRRHLSRELRLCRGPFADRHAPRRQHVDRAYRRRRRDARARLSRFARRRHRAGHDRCRASTPSRRSWSSAALLRNPTNPQEVAKWMRSRLRNPGRGWPWDRK